MRTKSGTALHPPVQPVAAPGAHGIAVSNTEPRGEFDRPAAHHTSGNQWNWCYYQDIDRIAIFGQCMRHIAVIAGVMHGSRHESIDEHCAGILVQFVLDGLAMRRNFNNDVDVVRHINAGDVAIEDLEGVLVN